MPFVLQSLRKCNRHAPGFVQRAILLFLLLAGVAPGEDLIRIASPVGRPGSHVHPSICLGPGQVLVVTYAQVNQHDLRVTRSTDGGRTWSAPAPFVHTIGKTHYPGSLTILRDGRIVHAWNRWDTDTTEKEPRSVLYAVSEDSGLTWGPIHALPRDPTARSVIRHPVTELDSDRWLMTLTDRTAVFHPNTGKFEPFGDGRHHGLVPVVRTPKGTLVSGLGLRSTDGGKTWAGIASFPNLKDQGWRHEMIGLANGWLLASEILGPGFGGDRIRYAISRDDGLTWGGRYEYYNPGRPIGGRACPRTVQIDAETLGVVFYDLDPGQTGGPGLFFLRIPISLLDET